jgi:Domain of unknown function (DUF4281)
MTADFMFRLANPVALLGWIILGVGIVWNKPFLRDVIAGRLWPLGLSAFYTILIGAFFFKAEGGFDTLANVQKLFTFPWAALAGWVHYLAFDLFMGATISRDIMKLGISRLFLIILLPLTFMFGPIGYVGFVIVRTALAKREIVK